MNKINWKVRLKNPVFWCQMVAAVLVPILAYAGLTLQDITSWEKLGIILQGAISNPYVFGLVLLSIFNAIQDPTTCGITDSERALRYDKPNK